MKAYIYGAGAQGRVVLDILKDQGQYAPIEFIDDDSALLGDEVNGTRVAGPFERVLEQERSSFAIVIAFGHPGVRMRLAAKVAEHSLPLLNAVHPSAVIAESARLGAGNMISAVAVVNSNARLGDHVIVNTAAVVEHDCVLEDFATVSPGVHVGGRTRIGRGAFICMGAIVLPRTSIGAGSVVAAGAVVTKPVPEATLVMGAPARTRSRIDESFDWQRLL